MTKISGYTFCACRDCFELTIDGGYCSECLEAGCDESISRECQAPGAYGCADELEVGMLVSVRAAFTMDGPNVDAWTGRTMRITKLEGTDAELEGEVWINLARLSPA